MIKQQDYQQSKAQEPVNNRIDALAAALGFIFREGLYVKEVKVTRRAYSHASTATVARKSKRYKKRFQMFPESFYAEVGALQAGHQMEVTNYVRGTNIPFRNVAQRLHSYSYNHVRMGEGLKKFAVTRSEGKIFVTRTA